MKKTHVLLTCLGLGLAGAQRAQAQSATPPPTGPTLEAAPLTMPSDEQSYKRETVFGLNFNTQGGLIGGVNVRVARVMDERWLRFWSLEGVFFKNPKEQSVTNPYTGGSFTLYKANYAFALRPSFGIQRILFRKAADSGVQVNGLLSVGPSLALLMPYYISYDQTAAQNNAFGPRDVIVDEAYDPVRHAQETFIYDRAPIFSGIGQTKVVPGVHLRGGLSFEYGRYRDAVAGAEVGFLIEGYSKRLLILNPPAPAEPNALNKQFFPSVYLTLYLGHRS
ncbi:hypothetical protein GO988_08125 [Hymenobacter sp. HMF4947]|uniref:Outer membrane protein beta-barrel domain-containing protein n=1 Tax=Hymenobacter ginkgonis TaxID=2682976 RepID=A0A7K1TD22_9BACT|nr:hypothetical protein [Hymenobacter ginkgonis]MVN76289.1 hypothetical protein [Hymenobacter ginkgonis]